MCYVASSQHTDFDRECLDSILASENYRHHHIVWCTKYFDIPNCLSMHHQCDRKTVTTERQKDRQKYDTNGTCLILCAENAIRNITEMMLCSNYTSFEKRQVTWLVIIEVQSESFGLVQSALTKSDMPCAVGCLLVGVECKGHPSFQHRVWYRVISLRYECIRRPGIILIP